jgi:hypothetical protein
MNPTHLLLLDDDPAYCLQLQEAAKAYRFEIHYRHNLEDGLDALIASRRYKAVILDGRCLLKPDQTGPARSNFVHHALLQIDNIEDEYNRTIPFCINSEHPDDFREDLEGIANVFRKTQQHDALFHWLKNTIALLPETTIRKQYHDVFEKVNTHFTEEEEELLIDVLQAAGSSDSALITTTLALLRRLLERTIDIACIIKLNAQPNKFAVGTGSRTRRIIDAMHPRLLPAELYTDANYLYKICSRFGNHVVRPDKKNTNYVPGKYGLQKLIYIYLELTYYLLY